MVSRCQRRMQVSSLNNLQYNAILHTYEKTRDKNRDLLLKRKAEVYQKVDGYRELDDAVSSYSVAYGKKLLDGDESALADLHETLSGLSDSKQKLLISYGYPADYLEPIYDCPDCQDTGYQNGQKCHCFRKQMTTLLYEQSGIQEWIAENNFSTLSEEYYSGEDLERFRAAVAACHDFIRIFPSGCPNLYLYGTIGTGKSFLSGCIAKELLDKGYSVIYFSAVQLFELLSEYSFDQNGKDTLYNPYEDLYNCDLVIIDDLGTELTNAFVSSKLFHCLNERQLRKKSTIISSNLSQEELKLRYSDRILSRVTANFVFRKLTGPDVRMCKKRKLNNRK